MNEVFVMFLDDVGVVSVLVNFLWGVGMVFVEVWSVLIVFEVDVVIILFVCVGWEVNIGIGML